MGTGSETAGRRGHRQKLGESGEHRQKLTAEGGRVRNCEQKETGSETVDRARNDQKVRTRSETGKTVGEMVRNW